MAVGAVSVLSGFGDGSFRHALTVPERVIQLGIVAATLLTVMLAGAQVANALRRRPVEAAA